MRDLPNASDAGLIELAKLPKLKEVHISKKNFSAEAIKRLRKAREDMRVNAN